MLRGGLARRVALVVLVAAIGYGGVKLAAAAGAGRAGRAHLLAAADHLSAQRFDPAARELRAARREFRRAERAIDTGGPAMTVARLVPIVRMHVRATQALAAAGTRLAESGLEVVAAGEGAVNPVGGSLAVHQGLKSLGRVHEALRRSRGALADAASELRPLEGKWLIGPLGSARDDLARRLPKVRASAREADQGLAAFLRFAGSAGPRRYLVFTQNPQEVRPTGGFIGSYGVLTADGRGISIDRFDSIESWFRDRPAAVVPHAEAPSPLRLAEPPKDLNLSNVNVYPEWPSAARLATALWVRGGEEPVDGVLAVSPEFLVRVLRIVGPVVPPSYGETITAENLVERTTFYTQVDRGQEFGGRRKLFVAEVGEEALRKLLDAPSERLVDLARAAGEAFDNREAVAWSSDTRVRRVLATRSWDGRLPRTEGDFVFAAEVAYPAKNGRTLRRDFDHQVTIKSPESATVTTTLKLTNPAPFDDYLNPGAASYVTFFGPSGAALAGSSDRPRSREKPVSGHPGAGYRLTAPPGGSDARTVTWRVPRLLRRLGERTWVYKLRVVPQAMHRGDTMRLSVRLPPGWKWEGAPPPGRLSLDEVVQRSWRLTGPP